MATFRRLGQSELLPRYIFAESLYARRRVLEVGAVASTLGQSARFLSTRGARAVVAADADLAAVQEAQSRLSGPNLRFRPLVFDDFEGGSFDLVIVADLSSYVLAPELLKELARLVAKSGYLMGGLRNPAGLALSTISDPDEGEAPPTYGQLLDALATHFSSIEVATQSPVLGYQLAFERGEGLQVDGSLAGHSEAAYYVVLAGQEPVRNFDPSWVQLPPEPLAFTGGKLEDAARRATEWRDRTSRLKEVLAVKTTELSNREAELREMAARLESAKDSVSRLTAQLETVREVPETLRERDDLANRIRRLDAELAVAKDRASDAEGRATLARNELEAFQRAQKEAALQTLAAQEQARLERARREEVGTQLEDSRNRLATAYDDLRRAQELAATERIDHERTRSQTTRLTEIIAAKEADLAAARERELRLSDARSVALQAIEGLEHSLSQAREQLIELREESSRRAGERASVERALDAERHKRSALTADLEREAARAKSFEEALALRSAELSALETELQATQSAQARALRDIETLSNSERTWREIAQQTDQRLLDTTANVQTLSDQLAQAEAEREAESARSRRLELDLGTVVTTERSLREQTEARLFEVSTLLKETSDDRDALIHERDDLRGALGDLQKARTGDLGQVELLGSERQRLDAQVRELERSLVEARRDHEEALLASAAKEQLLEARLAEHVTTLANETTALAAARAQVAQLEHTLQETATTLEQAQHSAREFEAALTQRSEQLWATNADIANVRSDLETSIREHSESRAASESLQAQLSAALGDLASAREELSATRAQFATREAELVEKHERVELEKRGLENRYRDLEATAKLAVERAVDLEDRIGELSKQLRVEEDERREERRVADESTSWLRGELASERELTTSQKSTLAAQQVEVNALSQQLAALGQTLQAQTAEQQARIAQLVTQTEARAAQLSALEQAQAQVRKEANDAHEQVQHLETARLELQAEVTRLTALTREQEARLAATTGELRSLHESSTEVSMRLRDALAEGARLTIELQDSLSARQQQQAVLTKTQDERTAFVNEVAALKAAAEERETELGKLNASLREFDAAKQTVESQAGSLQEQLASAHVLLATSKTHRAELEHKLATLASEFEVTAARAAQIEAALESSNQAHELLVASLRSDLEAERAAAARALQEKQEAAQAHAMAVKQSAQQMMVREQRITTLETSGAERIRELEAARTALAEARATADAADARAVQGSEAHESLSAQVRETKADLERARSEAREFEASKQRDVAELERLQRELSSVRASTGEALHHQAQETQATLAALQDELAVTRAALEGSTQQNKGREEAQLALAEQVRSLETEVAQLKAEALEVTQANSSGDEGLLREQIEALVSALHAAQQEAQGDLAGRKQAEELLLILRGKYGDLQHELSQMTEAMAVLRQETGRAAALAEQVEELQAENVLIEQERERLSGRVEELELHLRRERPATVADELEPPTRPYHVPALVEPNSQGAPRTKTGELEVFELDVHEAVEEGEEIVLLEDEATDPNKKKET